jgi:hypothetical protein
MSGLGVGLLEPELEGHCAIGAEIARICGLMNVGKNKAEPVLGLGMDVIDVYGSSAAITGFADKAGGCHERVLPS